MLLSQRNLAARWFHFDNSLKPAWRVSGLLTLMHKYLLLGADLVAVFPTLPSSRPALRRELWDNSTDKTHHCTVFVKCLECR